MAAPILLVHDDIAAIAALRRLLAREGHEVVLATSAADAVIAFGHYLPALIILSPAVEGGRGQVVLEELAQHPDAQLARVLLLGESVPGFGAPVVPLPLDGGTFLELVDDNLRSPSDADAWQLREQDVPLPSAKAVHVPEPEPWRATAPPEVSAELEPTLVSVPALGQTDWEEAATNPGEAAVAAAFEQAHQEVEAEAIAAIDSTLGQTAADEELLRLEEEVREEAARRRKARTEATTTEVEPFEALAQESGHVDVGDAAPDLGPDIESVAQATTASGVSDGDEVPVSAELRATEELARLERAREEAQAQADAFAAEARIREEDAQRAAARAEELAAREHAAREAAALAQEAAEVARQEAQALAERAAREAADAAQREREAQSALKASRQQLQHAESLVRSEREERERLEAELEALRQEAEQARVAAEREARREEKARFEREQEALLEKERVERDRLVAQLETARAAAEHELAMARERQEREEAAAAELSRMAQEERQALAQELEKARLAAARAQEEAHAQAERAAQAEALAEQAREEASEAAAKAVTLSFEVPGRPALGISSGGSVDRGALAHLVAKLARARAEVRLELQAEDALRTLWLRRGAVVGATSSLAHESLLDRARRDGLIDARQENELRLLRGASTAELVRVLVERGFLREAEVVPLVQRHTEQVALEALSEASSLYRLAEVAPEADVALVASPLGVLQLAAEALRRAVDAGELLHALGGLEAVPVVLEPVDGRELGFSEKERRLLTMVDGEATLEELLFAAGLRQEVGLSALAAARTLGFVELRPPVRPAPAAAADLDVRRLEAKYASIQDADYFSVLGLSRTAGAEEVRCAFEVLAAEFDPLKYVGHPDPALRHHAQRVHELLTEAASALEDDRLRAEYARHLVE
ncbi:MAG: DUF4388 domain-containing protein [Myxococcota bacterium]